MNARIHRSLTLLLALASVTVSGLACAEPPATAPVATTAQQPAPTHKDIVAWQRVGAPASLEV